MNARLPDLALTDERLREWGYFFRDRKRLEHCRSIEHRFRAASDDFSLEGWGDEETPPSVQPARSYSLVRALQTHDAVQALKGVQKWAITYHFAYPWLPRFMVLRSMRKWAGARMNWKQYEEQLDIGRCRVHTLISCCG